MSPAHLATEEEMAAPDDSWVWCACLWTKFLHLKLESEIRTTETGRVVLACAFLKHDRISKLSTLITLTLCTSGSEFRVRGRRRDVGNSCRCVGLWEECGFAFSNHGLSKVIAFTAFSIQQR